ncbi:hypothetical protein D6783_03305, partial [Candidatus Woesearchaeota archaeon]
KGESQKKRASQKKSKQELAILNNKERKELLTKISQQFGVPPHTLANLNPLLASKRGRIYLSTPALGKTNLKELRISSIGLYIATKNKDGTLRLSIEGSQLIGPHATKNIVELSSKEWDSWLRGEDIEHKHPPGYVIITHGNDYGGCGKANGTLIKNFVPKQRRIHGAPFSSPSTQSPVS